MAETHSNDIPWFAVQVKPSHERQVALALDGKQIDHFLPVRTVRTRWADRWKVIERPLLPGYLFCRLNPNEPGSIITTPGVVRIVKNGPAYAPVDVDELNHLRAAVDASLHLEAIGHFPTGSRVAITAGPLSGMVGTVIAYKNSLKLVLSVTLLQRAVLVELESSWVAGLLM